MNIKPITGLLKTLQCSQDILIHLCGWEDFHISLQPIIKIKLMDGFITRDFLKPILAVWLVLIIHGDIRIWDSQFLMTCRKFLMAAVILQAAGLQNKL